MTWTQFIPMNLQNLTAGGLVANITSILLIIAGVVALIYLIIGGYQYITAGGNADQAVAARTTILNAVIGLILTLASWAILRWVMSMYLTGRPPY